MALRLGHRESLDFDFFSNRSFQPIEFAHSIAYLKGQTVTQQAENTLSCFVETEEGPVKISFFGGLQLGVIEPPNVAKSNGIAMASLRDLFGTKCATVAQRNETKDYLDIHAILTKGGFGLAEGIAAAKAIYGRQYDPLVTLQALAYFDDLDNPLPEAVKSDLLGAVGSVSLQNIPTVHAQGVIGMAPHGI